MPKDLRGPQEIRHKRNEIRQRPYLPGKTLLEQRRAEHKRYRDALVYRDQQLATYEAIDLVLLGLEANKCLPPERQTTSPIELAEKGKKVRDIQQLIEKKETFRQEMLSLAKQKRKEQAFRKWPSLQGNEERIRFYLKSYSSDIFEKENRIYVTDSRRDLAPVLGESHPVRLDELVRGEREITANGVRYVNIEKLPKDEFDNLLSRFSTNNEVSWEIYKGLDYDPLESFFHK